MNLLRDYKKMCSQMISVIESETQTKIDIEIYQTEFSLTGLKVHFRLRLNILAICRPESAMKFGDLKI